MYLKRPIMVMANSPLLLSQIIVMIIDKVSMVHHSILLCFLEAEVDFSAHFQLIIPPPSHEKIILMKTGVIFLLSGVNGPASKDKHLLETGFNWRNIRISLLVCTYLHK